jgi:hypothetical protein
MAEFKKTPGSDEPPGLFDNVDTEALGQFAMAYWPVLLGGISLFLLIVLGKERIAVLVGILVVLMQGYLIFG